MKILVIGQGGREHTLVWKLAQSQLVEKIYCTPGNPGIAQIAETLSTPGSVYGFGRLGGIRKYRTNRCRSRSTVSGRHR